MCVLCHDLPAKDDGLCSRVSVTHQAYRVANEYPPDRYPEVWAAIRSALANGIPVFPEPIRCAPCADYEPDGVEQ